MTVNRPDGSAGDLVAPLPGRRRRRVAELYRHHAGRIFALPSRDEGSPDAGEVCCRGFLQGASKDSRVQGRLDDRHMAIQACDHHCLDFVRSRQVEWIVTNSIDDDMTPPAAGRDTPIERIDLGACNSPAAAGGRAPSYFHDVEGYEHREIREMLGLQRHIKIAGLQGPAQAARGTRMTPAHPKASPWTIMSDGALTATERADVEAHLAECADCRELVSDLSRCSCGCVHARTVQRLAPRGRA